MSPPPGEARSAEVGYLRGRLELTERAESTLRGALARERADRLEAEFAELRGGCSSWWRRLFGP